MSLKSSKLQQSLTRLKGWYVDKALPLWTARSYDLAHGGFYEALDFNGAPIIDMTRRVRVQWRQIHTFSESGLRGWNDGAEALAAKGFDFALEAACPNGGERGCVHSLSSDGAVIDDRRDLYDQAFLLLACASRWKAAEDSRAIDLAEKTAAFLDRELASPHRGWLEDDQGTLPRRQNPHMHLFEAFTALYAATHEQMWIDHAGKTLALMQSCFLDPQQNTIREFFDLELRHLSDQDLVEPGHMFEWVWLLNNYEKNTGRDLAEQRRALFTRAVELGEDPDFFGFVGNNVTQPIASRRTDKRLWPQTEYIRACLVSAGEGDDDAGRRAEALINDLFKSYLKTPVAGLWIDEFDKTGAPVAPNVPASILYHIFEAVVEAVRSSDGQSANATDAS